MDESPRAEPTAEVFPGRNLPSAGVGRRIVATLVDMAIFVGFSVFLWLPTITATPAVPSDGGVVDVLSVVASDTPWLGRAAGMLGLWVALWWCYFLVGWGLMGCTPGKWLLGLRVVDHQGRCPIGASRAALRLLAYMASSVTLVGGHLLAVLRGDRRALHDVLAGTRVVVWRGRRREAASAGENGDEEP